MATTNNIVFKFDKTSYNVGERMTLTFTGGAVKTSDVTLSNLSAVITLSDGSTVNVAVPSTLVKDGQTTNLTAKIASITDPSGRVWVVATDGLSAWSIA